MNYNTCPNHPGRIIESHPCPLCGTMIRKVPLRGGGTAWPFWCPRCGDLWVARIPHADVTGGTR